MSSATVACPCGSLHPTGFLCEKAASLLASQKNDSCGCSHNHTQEVYEHTRNEPCNHDHTEHDHTHEPAHAHSHDHAHADGGCCGHDHAEAAPVDLAVIGEASDTRAIYRIMNMDCPMEEALIRKKLGGVPGITNLDFNLIQRVLTVDHVLPSTEPIIAALKAIDMTPEVISANQGTVAIFSVNGMDCPVEENLIRAKLNGMPGVLGLEFNLMQRTLKVRHEPSALPSISEALTSLNMDAKLMDMEAGESDVIPEPKIPWGKLAIAGVAAGLSEALS